MGILDDAIREHLELKRRLGADPAEVERLEREAFGAQGAAAAEAEGDAGAPPVTAAEPVAAAEPEPAPEPAAEEPAPPLVAETEPEPVPAEPAVDQPTRQFTLEEFEDAGHPVPATATEAAPPEAEPADAGEHDELEETPDFLQETPDHDRLWFEQKPPKDFDF